MHMETKTCYLIQTDSLKYYKEGTSGSVYRYTDDATKARTFRSIPEAMKKAEEINKFYEKNGRLISAFGNSIEHVHVVRAFFSIKVERV